MSAETHEEYAQRVYGIAPADLTKEQRAAVKLERFVEMYGTTSRGIARLREVFSEAGLDFSGAARRLGTREILGGVERKTTSTPVQGNFVRLDFRDAEVRVLASKTEN